MTHRLMQIAAGVATLALTGCDRLDAAWTAFQGVPSAPLTGVAGTGGAVTPVPGLPTVVPPPVIPRLTPTGHGLPVKAQPQDTLQYAASVAQVQPLAEITGMDGKLFGTAGGDPAMNGLLTFVAFNRGPADGWWIYQVGDFQSFKVLNQTRGQVDLEVEENTIDDATGTIGTRTRHIIVAFTVEPITDQPVRVRFMPAA